MTQPFRLAVVALVLGLTCVAIRADDWPQWRGPERTGHVPAGAAVPQTLPTAPQVLWHIPLGNGLSSPIVSGGKVFYIDNQNNKEVVHAAEAATGSVLWSAPLDDVHKDSQSPPGPRCTPVVDGDRVYAQSCRGQLTCFNTGDGKVVWQTNFVKDFGATFIGEKGQAQGAVRHGYNASPLVDGDRLIVLVGGKDASIVSFDKRTGTPIWKSGNDTPAYAAPVIATVAGTRQLLAFMVEGLVGLDPATGKSLWRVPLKTQFGRHVMTPVVHDDVVCVASHTLGLIGIKVTKSGDAFQARPAWTAKESAINYSTPVLEKGHLYGVGPQKNLICVDVATGRQTWSKDGLLAGNAGNAHAGLIVMGDKIAVLTDGGQVLLIAADPKAYRELGRAQVCGQNWCNPAYANGNLYTRDNRELWCVRLVP